MSLDIFGQYQSQTTRALASIDSSKYPDTNKDFEANVIRLNQDVDYISKFLQTMQKGVDSANKDPISRIRDLVAGLGILLGGGSLTEITDINLGDLQYYLPAIGALLGFDSTTPFPINLFEAAEHLLLGYIVPLDVFASTIEDLILSFFAAIGIDEDALNSLRDLLDAVVSVTGDIQTLFTNLANLLDVFGINSSGFGPFADLWHAVTQLLGGLNLQTLGDLVDPIFHALAPWIEEVAQFVNQLDLIIKAFSGGLTNVQGILNFASIFTSYLNFLPSSFDIPTMWVQIVENILLPSGILNPVIDSITSVLGGLVLGGPASTISWFLGPEIAALNLFKNGISQVIADIEALWSGHDGRIEALETAASSGTTGLNAGTDGCNNTTRFTHVSGGSITSDGFVISSTSTSANYHTDGPATVKHGIKFKVRRKQNGVCVGVICADTGFTNFFGLEVYVGGFGNDYARIVYGVSPTAVIDLVDADGEPIQWNGAISENWEFEIYYSDSPTTNTVYVTLNGNQILTYTDVGNLVAHTPGTDIHVGWISNLNNNSVYKGFGLTQFTYADKAA